MSYHEYFFDFLEFGWCVNLVRDDIVDGLIRPKIQFKNIFVYIMFTFITYLKFCLHFVFVCFHLFTFCLHFAIDYYCSTRSPVGSRHLCASSLCWGWKKFWAGGLAGSKSNWLAACHFLLHSSKLQSTLLLLWNNIFKNKLHHLS